MLLCSKGEGSRMSSKLNRFFGPRSGTRWLLHGSPKRLTVALEPRLPRQVTGKAHFSVRGVYATDHVLLAVLYALLGSHGNSWGWRIGVGETRRIEVVLRGRLRTGPGYLYVVPRQPFVPVSGRHVWRSKVPVVPVAREMVSAEIFHGLVRKGVFEVVQKGAA